MCHSRISELGRPNKVSVSYASRSGLCPRQNTGVATPLFMASGYIYPAHSLETGVIR